ncbi:MAG TPA: ATP-binding protein [Vicinamibacteria bacterium]|nr:ATP-binding protein [Vicinamibacteria bacterium]
MRTSLLATATATLCWTWVRPQKTTTSATSGKFAISSRRGRCALVEATREEDQAPPGRPRAPAARAIRPWLGYPIALAAVGAAGGLWWAMRPVLGSEFPLTFFVLAVAASAWIGGFGPGLLATLAALVAADVFSFSSSAALPITPAGHTIRLAIFAVAAVAISIASEKRRRAILRAEDAAVEAEERGTELVRSQDRFQRIVETAQEGIWHVDAEGRTVYVNRHMAGMLGYEPEELIGGVAFDLVPEEDAASARQAWARRERGEAERVEFRFRHREGHLVWLRATATPVFERGQFAGAFAMLTDVTGERRSEAALRASETRKETQLAVTQVLAQATELPQSMTRVLEATGRGLGWSCGALWRVDREANVLRCSQFWAQAELPAAEFEEATRRTALSPGVGLPGRVWTATESAWISDLGKDVDFPRKAAAAAAGLRSGFAFPILFGRECLGVLEFFSETARDADAELLGTFLGVGSQVGQFMERMRIERERQTLLESERAARRDAEAANRAKDEFLATLSHELRTPLNAIVGWAHLLRTGQLDPGQTARAVEVIDRNAKAQSQIVADVLDVSRIVMGKLRLEVRPVELSAVVQEALETLRPAAAAKELDVTLDVGAGGKVSGDPDRLQQIVWNLVANAIKFTPAGGQIRVRLERLQGHLDVVVEDSGVGIRPDFLPHVFERFRQSDSSSTRAHGGLGLGLALVRHLVELHGGSVSATSRGEGQGSTFIVSLPLRFSAEGSEVEEPLPVDLDGLSVLVVDDDGEARELVATALRRAGAQVRTAATASEALADMARHPPAVIVSDLEMPGEDGYQLIRRIRALDPARGGTIPAAALTAHVGPEEVRRALEAGFQWHMAKPAAPDEIARAVAALARSLPEH